MTHKTIRYAALLAFAACAGLAAGAAAAATATASFQVTATVNAICNVNADALGFGNYDPSASDLDSTTQITAQCTQGTTYTIALDDGANSANTAGTTRSMSNGDQYLSYELYTDAARTNVWDATNTVSHDSVGGDNVETVYGRVPGGQFVGAGSYSDTINVTVTY